MRSHLPILLLALASLGAGPDPLPYPAGVSLPVRVIGIDPAYVAPVRPALAAAAQAVAGAWLARPATLTQMIGSRRPVPINAKKRADRILTGVPPSGPGPRPLAVEPAWCRVLDRDVFFVTVADARSNQLLASKHVAFPRGRWDSASLSASLATLARAALTAAAERGGRPEADGLHVGLSLGRETDRQDEGSSHCLGLLLEEQLAPSFTVARNLGLAELATMRDLLGQPAALTRASRAYVLRWQLPWDTAGGEPAPSLPVTYTLSATVAESVFGHPLPAPMTSQVQVKDGPGGTLAMTPPAALMARLVAERASLKLADWPEVARVYGAWVYLDRGRAWGLKMDDRLLADVGGQTVKGHVVRFFGPEAGLKSPRGFPIEEGAILYIRKGQKLPQVGTEFHFDPRTFPAPYPAKP